MSLAWKKLKKGTIREDGMVFWGYNKECAGGERWLSPEKFASDNERQKNNHKSYYPEYYKKNRKKKIESVLTHRKNNLEERLKKEKVYRFNSKERIREQNRLRRVKIKISSLPKNERSLIREVYKMATRISICTGIQHHVDHVTPLARGGLHTISNLQVLPAIINIRKSDKLQ